MNNRALHIMISAGETSGDLHGAYLARALRELVPEVQLFGMGGPQMRQAGVELLFDPTSLSTVGFWEALRSYRALKSALALLERALAQNRPDVLVVIDFPGFHLRLAEAAKKMGVPVVYYFSPSAWAWGRGRALQVARSVALVAAVFPFEAEVYRQAGAEVNFIGHPLLDIVRVEKGREELRRELAGESSPVVGLLPGSRRQEIEFLLPPLLGAAERIRRRYPAAAFLLPLASSITPEQVEPYLRRRADLPVRVVQGRTYEVMAACDLILVASGTATLEATCLGTPMVVVYRLSWPTYLLARLLVRVPYIALPNIVAGWRVVPELIQRQATPERIAAEALALLDSPPLREEMRERLHRVVELLGQPGAVRRAAKLVVAVARGRSANGRPDYGQ
ncbi:MAG: lipid-A-disaccharide synthase [Bacillota bacterium]|nr:lipid-A-disaccharide synthase [Bacillota bacterium]